MDLLSAELRELAKGKAAWYQSRGDGLMGLMQMREAEEQYIHMARGGDGSINHMGNIREHYYTGKPNAFFQAVCDYMGWNWRS